MSGDNFCFASSEAEFTASAKAKCLVTAAAQVAPEKTPTTQLGPFFRIAIRDNGVPGNDGEYGFYITPSGTSESGSASRPDLIEVEAGHTYSFGAYLGFPGSDWVGGFAETRVSYVCFA